MAAIISVRRKFVLLLLLGWASASTRTESHPNILFIMTDDQGYADVGYSNPSCPIPTPNINKLANDGIRLKQYYVHPTCTPTRASLLTGRYAVNVGQPFAHVPSSPGGLDAKYRLLPQELEKVGYKNHIVGKWHLGASKRSFHPLKRGFHSFYGCLGGGINFYSKQCGNGRFDFWRDYKPEYENKTHATTLLTNEAVDVIDRHATSNKNNIKTSPMFLYLAYNAPHDPLLTDPKYDAECKHIPNRYRRDYCNLVAGIDDGIGKVVASLENNGMLENTVIIYSSDNGGVPFAGAFNYPFRGGKATVFEGGVRVPAFIYGPKSLFPQSLDYNGIFHVSDFYPTILKMIEVRDALGIQNHETLDGINQYDALTSLSKEYPRRSVHIHRDIAYDSHAYRRDNWKIIVGNALDPFPFHQVYEEPTDWLVPNGGWIRNLNEIIMNMCDFLFGPGHWLWAQYGQWILLEGIISPSQIYGQSRSMSNIKTVGNNSYYQDMYPTDINKWKSSSDPLAGVFLYDVETDPSEFKNLANIHPELVLELLKEAEEYIKDAPPQEFGLLNSKNAPMAPVFYNWFWSSLPTLKSPLGRAGSEDVVIPYGLYLDDNVDIGGPSIVYNDSQTRVVLASMIRTYLTLIFILIIFPILLIKLVRYFF